MNGVYFRSAKVRRRSVMHQTESKADTLLKEDHEIEVMNMSVAST